MTTDKHNSVEQLADEILSKYAQEMTTDHPGYSTVAKMKKLPEWKTCISALIEMYNAGLAAKQSSVEEEDFKKIINQIDSVRVEALTQDAIDQKLYDITNMLFKVMDKLFPRKETILPMYGNPRRQSRKHCYKLFRCSGK